jgi:hypothetical protein
MVDQPADSDAPAEDPAEVVADSEPELTTQERDAEVAGSEPEMSELEKAEKGAEEK